MKTWKAQAGRAAPGQQGEGFAIETRNQEEADLVQKHARYRQERSRNPDRTE
jgi:hypothetical protein